MDSYVSHDGFRLVNNVLKEEYDDMKEKFKQIVENYLIYRTLLFLQLQFRNNTESKNPRVPNTKTVKTNAFLKYAVCGRKSRIKN